MNPKMQNQKELEKLNHFLRIVSPIVTDIAKTILQSLDYEIYQKGQGLDTVFVIKELVKTGEKETTFRLHNLFLEIATVDRDEAQLRFDENLQDFDYFLAKMIRLTQSKLTILFYVLGEENIDKAIKNITQNAKQYERIRILSFDQAFFSNQKK